MQALIVTFGLKLPVDELCPLLQSYSRSLETCEGLVDHYWLLDGGELGLFHVFSDEQSAWDYLESRLLATLTAHEGCSGHTFVRWYNVVADGIVDESHIQKHPTTPEFSRTLVPA